MSFQNRSCSKDLCACQKISNTGTHTWSYASVVQPCRCYDLQKTLLPVEKSMTTKHSQSLKKESIVPQSAQLLWKVLSTLRSEEETDGVVLRGKHWVYVPRLQLSKRLQCTNEDIQRTLDVLCRDGYVESLHLSLEDEKSSFVRINKKKYKEFFWVYPAINHQSLHPWS